MRRNLVLVLGAGLIASFAGCKYTAGRCDCYPPPVESLLVAPQPAPGKKVVPVSGAIPVPATVVPHGAAPANAHTPGILPSTPTNTPPAIGSGMILQNRPGPLNVPATTPALVPAPATIQAPAGAERIPAAPKSTDK